MTSFNSDSPLRLWIALLLAGSLAVTLVAGVVLTRPPEGNIGKRHYFVKVYNVSDLAAGRTLPQGHTGYYRGHSSSAPGDYHWFRIGHTVYFYGFEIVTR